MRRIILLFTLCVVICGIVKYYYSKFPAMERLIIELRKLKRYSCNSDTDCVVRKVDCGECRFDLACVNREWSNCKSSSPSGEICPLLAPSPSWPRSCECVESKCRTEEIIGETANWEDLNIPACGSLIDVTFEVQAPFSDAKLTINGLDNSISYFAEERNSTPTSSKGKAHRQQIEGLIDLMKKNEFFSMENRFQDPEDPQDGSTYKIETSIVPCDPDVEFPSTHTVSCYEFRCSQEFIEIKNKIIEIWGKEILEIGV